MFSKKEFFIGMCAALAVGVTIGYGRGREQFAKRVIERMDSRHVVKEKIKRAEPAMKDPEGANV